MVFKNFKYLVVVFKNDGKQNMKIDRQIGESNAVLCVLLFCVHRTEAFKYVKAVSFSIGLCSDPHQYGHDLG